jgi:hypothetical protein
MRRERDAAASILGPPRFGSSASKRSWRGVRHRPRGHSCRARGAHGAGEVAHTPRCSTSAPPPPDTSTHCVGTSWRTSPGKKQTTARPVGGPLTIQGQCQRQLLGSVVEIRRERSAARPENAGPRAKSPTHHGGMAPGCGRAAPRAPTMTSGRRASRTRRSSGERRPLGRRRLKSSSCRRDAILAGCDRGVRWRLGSERKRDR